MKIIYEFESEKEYLELKEKTTLETISKEQLSKIVTKKLNEDTRLYLKGFDVSEGSTTHDIVMATVDVLVQVLKETEKRAIAKELIINGNAKDKDLEYLKDVAEKEFRVCKHEKIKEPCVINIFLNIDKDIDIEKIANELIQKLKNVSI